MKFRKLRIRECMRAKRGFTVKQEQTEDVNNKIL